jgi:amylosucrase
VQRIALSDEAIAQSRLANNPQNKVATGLQKLIDIRRQHSVFGQGQTHILPLSNQAVFAYARRNQKGQELIAVCNFSEHPQSITRAALGLDNGGLWQDLLQDNRPETPPERIEILPYQVMWFLS